MKRLFVALGAIIVLLLAAVLAVPFFVSEQTVKKQIISQIEETAGWRLRIDGPISISALPFLKMSAQDIGLSGAAGADGIEFASAREVRFGLGLLPLLSGKVRVTGVTLIEPNIFLEVDKTGRTSWAPRATLQSAAPQDTADDAAGGSAVQSLAANSTLRRLRFGKLRIRDGLAVWDDQRSGQLVSVKNINITVSMPSLNSALDVEGKVVWNDLTVAFESNVAAPLALADGGESDLSLSLSAAGNEATLEGTLRQQPALAFAGTIEASAPAIRKLLKQMGQKVAGLKGFEDVSLAARLSYRPQGAAVDDLKLGFDDSTLTGRLAVALDGPRPALSGKLALDRIDFERYRGKREAARKEKEKTAAEGPPDVAIDLSPLKAADADLAIEIGAMTGSDVNLGKVATDIKLKNGRLDLLVNEAAVLGGRVAMALTADGSGKVPAFAGRLRSSGLSLKAIAALAGEQRPITGEIGSDLTFKTEGATSVAVSDALVLAGKASLRDGSVGGLDLADAFGGDKKANRIDGITMDATIAGLGKPVDVTGALNWRGERFRIAADASPAALAAGNPSPVSASVSSNRLSVGFEGKASAGGRVNGAVKLSTPSVRKLAAWLGNPLPPGKGLEKFSFSGNLKLTKRAVAFSNATLSLDDTSGKGSGKLVFGDKRPSLTAKLALDVLTLDPYLGKSGKGSGGGGAAKRGWSREKIDFSGLRAADADLTLSTKGIRWDEIKIGPSKLSVKLAAGTLTANLEKLSLYKGTGTGKLTLDGSGKAAAVNAKFDLDKLSAYPFLRDAADFEWLEGSGNLSVSLTTAGASQYDFVNALDGNARMDFRDGAVRGINIAQMMRGLSADVLLGWQENKSAKTDFSSFVVAFDIKDGIASGKKFRMVGPLVRVGGDGTIDMPKQRLKWKVDPKVVPSLEGQKAGKKKKNKNDGKMVGLGVPIIIEGPWANPKIYPDIEGILSNPQAAFSKLKSLGGGLLDGDAGDTVEKLLDGKGGAGAVGDLLGGGKKGGGLGQLTDSLGLGGNQKQKAGGKNGKGNNKKNNKKKNQQPSGNSLLDGLLSN
ncbi:MAG: hypothetical protein C0606_05040 [Hyphomicrobiales bacterium]|nr:MAG: hypothetical protein C0606_05040 [Hyphomicrobiales bacterium]